MWAIGCDSAGEPLLKLVEEILNEYGMDVVNVGPHHDYTDAAVKVAGAVSRGEAEKGVLICGTGVGMAMAANKFHGVRAALCHDVFTAKATRLHNDSNILTMGARVIGPGPAGEIARAFITTDFSGDERHIRRIQAIAALENK